MIGKEGKHPILFPVPGKTKPQNSATGSKRNETCLGKKKEKLPVSHDDVLMRELRSKRAGLKDGEDPNSPEILRPIELWKEQQRKIPGSRETKQVINFKYATNEDPPCPEMEMREYIIEYAKKHWRKRAEKGRNRRRKKNEKRRKEKESGETTQQEEE